MSASRARIVNTQLIGEAWERVTGRLDAEKMFNDLGWGFTTTDEFDKCKIENMPDYVWSLDDAPADDDEAEEAEGSEADPEELGGGGDDGGDDGEEEDEEDSSTDDEVDPGEWEDTGEWESVPEHRAVKAGDQIAHKFYTEVGWEVGKVVRRDGRRSNWLVKYATDVNLYMHELRAADYGPGAVWVHVQRPP